jgi:ATP-binding cassette subfamily B protein
MMIAIALQTGVETPILFFSVLSEIKNKAWQWSIIPIIAMIIIVIIATIAMKLALPKFQKIQILLDNINRVTREQLNGIRVVRAYNAEEYQTQKFETLNHEIMTTHLFAGRVMSIMRPLISTMMSSISLIVYWVGAYLIINAIIDIKLEIFADMVVYASYAVQIMSAVMTVLSVFIMFPRYKIHLDRVNELLNTEVKIQNGTQKDLGIINSIKFKNVSFQYPDGNQNVIEDISFDINKGETVAIIGTTASGKTSLINLLLRLYDVSAGQILINDIDIRDLEKEALNTQISYVPQKSILFSGNIAQNVAYGETDIHKDLLWKALNISQANSFVEALSEQELASVAQNGTNFSGGQKQRLSIARAVYKNASLFIFDDSFSALDYKTDKAVRNALSTETQNAIKIIIAQRIGTIKYADKILVLDEGKLVGIGKHQELLNKCKTYKEIALSQLTEESYSNGIIE